MLYQHQIESGHGDQAMLEGHHDTGAGDDAMGQDGRGDVGRDPTGSGDEAMTEGQPILVGQGEERPGPGPLQVR